MTVSPFEQIQAAFSSGDLAEVARRIEAEWRRLGPWGQVTQPFRLAYHRADYAEAAKLGQLAVDQFPDRADSYDLLALSLLASGRSEDALKLSEAALARFPDHVRLLRRAKTAARKSNRPELAVHYLRRLIEAGDDGAETHIELGRLLLQTFRGAEALESLEAALTRGASRDALLKDLAMASERAGRFEEALVRWAEVEEADPADAAVARDGRRRVDQHRRAQVGSVRHVADMTRLLDAFEGDEAVFLSPPGDLKAWRRRGAGDLLLVFGGLQAMMGVAPPSAPQSMVKLSRLSILSFCDPRRSLMMAGAASLAEDYETTLDRLRFLLEAWRIRRLFVLGYSAGGYPALRYGADLGAHRVVLMSGWIATELADQGPLLASVLGSVGHMYEEPTKLVARAPGTEFVLAYGAENARDEAHARTLERAANVTLRPVRGVASHTLAIDAAHDELLADLLGV